MLNASRIYTQLNRTLRKQGYNLNFYVKLEAKSLYPPPKKLTDKNFFVGALDRRLTLEELTVELEKGTTDQTTRLLQDHPPTFSVMCNWMNRQLTWKSSAAGRVPGTLNIRQILSTLGSGVNKMGKAPRGKSKGVISITGCKQLAPLQAP